MEPKEGRGTLLHSLIYGEHPVLLGIAGTGEGGEMTLTPLDVRKQLLESLAGLQSAGCPFGHYACPSGACSPYQVGMCNGWLDCEDGSDEQQCEEQTSVVHTFCQPHQFDCGDGNCVGAAGAPSYKYCPVADRGTRGPWGGGVDSAQYLLLIGGPAGG